MQSTITWIDAIVTKPEPHNFSNGVVYLVIVRDKDGKYYDPTEAAWQWNTYQKHPVGSWTTVTTDYDGTPDDIEGWGEGSDKVAYWAELPTLPDELLKDQMSS